MVDKLNLPGAEVARSCLQKESNSEMNVTVGRRDFTFHFDFCHPNLEAMFEALIKGKW